MHFKRCNEDAVVHNNVNGEIGNYCTECGGVNCGLDDDEQADYDYEQSEYAMIGSGSKHRLGGF